MTNRLEKGTFAWPKPPLTPASLADTADAKTPQQQSAAAHDKAPVKLPFRAEALEMLLSGIDLKGATMRPWYEDPNAKALPLA